MKREIWLLRDAADLSQQDVFVDDETFYLVKSGRPATGTLTICNEEDELEFRLELFNGQKHGLCESFFPNGDLQYWCRFSHGKQDLYDERFDKHGRLIQSDCWHLGRLHGKCKSYEFGQVSALQEYKNGKLHGLWETYGPRNVTFFHGQYVDGKPDGWHVWRFINNKIEAECHFDLGIKTRRWRDFYNTGRLKRERFYEDGKLVDEDRRYFENGVLAAVTTYADGKLNSPCMEFYPNGELKRSIPYDHGLRKGFERHYGLSLSMRREVDWRDGRALSDLNYLIAPKTMRPRG